MLTITYVEFLFDSPNDCKLIYAEWVINGHSYFAHADAEPPYDTDKGETPGIPPDVRQAIAKLVLEEV
jgi:hypothetical protein